MTFAERLKEVRLVNGLTQEELAEMVSVEKMSISKYESGKMMTASSTLIALFSALSVDISYFFREISVQLKTEPKFRMRKNSEKLSKKEQQQIFTDAGYFGAAAGDDGDVSGYG